MAYSAEVVKRARARLAQAKEDRESENRQHLAVAYARGKGLVDFCGIVATKSFEYADVLAAGALITTDRKLYFPVYSAETALTAETGIIAKVTAQKLTGVRCLF